MRRAGFAHRLAELGWGGIHVAVNISSKQLAADDFIASVHSSVKEGGIQPSQLELEITESILVASMEEATGKLAKLKGLGVGLTLDNFGTRLFIIDVFAYVAGGYSKN